MGAGSSVEHTPEVVSALANGRIASFVFDAGVPLEGEGGEARGTATTP